jgi:hypothetical protein
MGAVLGDLDEYFSPGLTLTVRGQKYVVPLPNAELGLWCQRMARAAGAISAADTEQEMAAAVARVNALPELKGDLTLQQRVLGTAYDEMMADDVPHHFVEFCGATAYIWIIGGEEAATRYWQAGGRPEAMRPMNRQERRAAAKKATGGSRTAAAGGTRSQASTSGTNTPRKSAAAKKAAPSRGKPS